MVLLVDIGNTNIVLGGLVDDEVLFVTRLSTNKSETEDEYAAKIKSIVSLNKESSEQIEGAIISSVVPPLTTIVKKAIHMVYGIDALVVGPGIKTGIKINIDNPGQVGADLICACVAANSLYSGNCLIVDMGTATKLIVVDENAEFLGVTIAPGMEIAMNALASGTALLPQIGLEAPKSVLGRNTVECMQSGIVYGNACMIDGMIERIRDELKCDLTLIATGGLSSVVIPHCKNEIIEDSLLLLKGLGVLYRKNK